MKITIDQPEEKTQDIKFPCLMKGELTNDIYLVFNKSTGITINSELWPSGAMISQSINISYLTPLPKGTKIILEQE